MWQRSSGRVLVNLAVCVPIAVLLGYETRLASTPWELAAGLAAIVVSACCAHRLPLLALIVSSATSTVTLFYLGGRVPVWPVLLMFFIGFLSGRRMDRVRPALLTFSGIAVLGVPVALLAGEQQLEAWARMAGLLLFASMFPWQLGRYFRLRQQLLRTGWQRAEELEKRQRLVADQARLRERARIAGDMHDSLGHELSLIAVRAGALEIGTGLDPRQQAAAGQLRESAAAAIDRLREIIGVLRDEVDQAPGDAGVHELVRRAEDSGMAIVADLPPEYPPDVPPMVDRAAYRIVQESLTNAAKYAPGAAVHLRLTHEPGRTEVRVRNDRPPAGPLPGLDAGNSGLAGLRERVRLLGGTLSAGPERGGFEVHAVLPHHGSPAEDSPVTDAERSESAAELDRARRQVRRSLVYAFVLPVGILVAIVGTGTIIYSYNWLVSVLDPADYARLEVGTPRAEFAGLLPGDQRIDRPVGSEPPVPSGAVCEYYGTGTGLLSFRSDAFRLCFERGRLVSKDLLLDTGKVDE